MTGKEAGGSAAQSEQRVSGVLRSVDSIGDASRAAAVLLCVSAHRSLSAEREERIIAGRKSLTAVPKNTETRPDNAVSRIVAALPKVCAGSSRQLDSEAGVAV